MAKVSSTALIAMFIFSLLKMRLHWQLEGDGATGPRRRNASGTAALHVRGDAGSCFTLVEIRCC